MKNTLFSLAFSLVAFAAFAQPRNPAMTQTYASDWKRIDSLAAKGLYKSALDRVEGVYGRAKTDANFPQLIKASLQRAIFSTFLDDDAYPRLVASLQADVAQSPEPAKSVLNSVLGEVVWQYYQQNRYRLMNRATVADDIKPTPDKATATGTREADNDIRTWDAPRLAKAATEAYQKSLYAEKTLLATSVGTFSEVIDKGDAAARTLRPTLFDLLANRAIDFFRDTEADISRPIFRFELDQPSYFFDAADFAKLKLTSRDSVSGRFLALQTYQRLIAAHLSNADPSALTDVDLARLRFVHENSVDNLQPDKNALYRQALENGIKRWRGNPTEAVYSFVLAGLLAKEGFDYQLFTNESPKFFRKQAAEICRKIIAQYPKTMVGQNAEVLLATLLTTELSVTVEEITTPNAPFRASVSYRNLPTLHYRIVKLSADEPDGSQIQNDKDREKWLAQVVKRTPAATGTTALPDDGDLQTHRTEIVLPGLSLGHYVLIISADTKFLPTSKQLEQATFQVSEMGYLVDNYHDNANQTYLLTNRTTGQPLANVAVQIFRSAGQSKGKLLTEGKTDAQGQYIARINQLNAYEAAYIVFGKGDDQLTIVDVIRSYSRNEPQPVLTQSLKLFTDRAIYRPGQPIYVKGLLFAGKENSFSVVAGQSVEVRLQDANGEEVAKQTFKTNDFGTFNGSFVAPVGRLTGRMTLETGIDQGQTTIRVEEYKRPTFEVLAAPVAGSYKLGQSVSVSATAKTYAGAVVDGASVRYRITRQQRQFWWDYCWWRPFRPSVPQEIANGTLTTNAQGTASLTFTATPDATISRADNPTFEFVVTFDVTDPSGETRSTTQTVRVGYSALVVQVPIPAVIDVSQDVKPVSIKVENMAGEAVSAQTNVVISRLQTPVRALRPRLWSRPDRFVLTRSEFEKQFPNDLYDNDLDPTTWAKTDVSRLTNPASLTLNNLLAGQYVVEVIATGPANETATQRVYFAVVNAAQPVALGQPGLQTKLDKAGPREATYQPGESATLTIGNGLDPNQVHYLLQVYDKHKLVREEWLVAGVGQPLRVVFPIQERDRGGFVVRVSGVRNGCRAIFKQRPKN
jgi:MG2 domain